MTARTACIYVRLAASQQGQNDPAALRQLEEVRGFAARQGLSVSAEYVDLGASGVTDERAGFMTMISQALATPKQFDFILVQALSRLFRNGRLLEQYRRKLEANGVQIVAIDNAHGANGSASGGPS